MSNTPKMYPAQSSCRGLDALRQFSTMTLVVTELCNIGCASIELNEAINSAIGTNNFLIMIICFRVKKTQAVRS